MMQGAINPTRTLLLFLAATAIPVMVRMADGQAAADGQAPAAVMMADIAPPVAVSALPEAPVERAEEVVQAGSQLARYRLQLVSMGVICMLFFAFLFMRGNVTLRGLLPVAPLKGFPLCSKKKGEAAMLADERLDLDAKKEEAMLAARIEEGDQEKQPLIMPAMSRQHQPPTYRSVWDCPVYRYGGLDAAMEALSKQEALSKHIPPPPPQQPVVHGGAEKETEPLMMPETEELAAARAAEELAAEELARAKEVLNKGPAAEELARAKEALDKVYLLSVANTQKL